MPTPIGNYPPIDELLYAVSEAYNRLPAISEAKQTDLLRALASIIERNIIEPTNKDYLFTLLIGITALHSRVHLEELCHIWQAVGRWRHHQAMLLKFCFGFLCSHAEQLWIDAICQIFEWLESDLISSLLYASLTPANMTSRSELSLTSECQAIIEKVKTAVRKNRKRLYEPESICNAHISYLLLIKTGASKDRENSLLFTSVLLAFDDSAEDYIRSMALEFLQITYEMSFENFTEILKDRVEDDNTLEAHLAKYSFEYGCKCTLKTASTLAWYLFAEFAPGVCNEAQVLSGVLDLLCNIGRSMRSLEKGRSVLEACLEAVYQVALANTVHDAQMSRLVVALLNAPIEDLYLKGQVLYGLTDKSDIDTRLLLRGLFLDTNPPPALDCKQVVFFFWLKQLLRLTDQERLSPGPDVDASLITLYNRTSLRSQFWPKLILLAVGSFGEPMLVSFIEAWVQQGECTPNFVHLCQNTVSFLPKDTLLAVIDRLADAELGIVDDCIKRMINAFDALPEHTEPHLEGTSNPFLICPTDFDLFQESLTLGECTQTN